MINCFWVSGQYKGQGHGYNLLQSVMEDAKKQKKNGLVTVVGAKKNPRVELVLQIIGGKSAVFLLG